MTTVAGREGLNREVQRIAVSELPDAVEWLEGNELVCSSGLVLVKDEQMQRQWLQGMAQKQVAALIIKPERFLGEIPEAMLEEADRLNFPLITVSNEVRWTEIIEKLTNMMIQYQTANLRLAYQIQQDFTNMVLDSKSLEEIIREIARLTSAGVIMEDKYFETIACCSDPDGTDATLVLQRTETEQQENMRRRFPSDTNPSIGMQEVTIQFGHYFGSRRQISLPVVAGERFFGWLSLLLNEHSREDDILRVVLGHGATVAALTLLNEHALFLASTQRDAYYIGLLAGTIPASDIEIRRFAGLLGLDVSRPTRIVLYDLDTDIDSRMFRAFQENAQRSNRHARVFRDGNRIMVTVSFPYDPNISQALQTSRRVTRETMQQITKHRKIPWNAGISRIVSGCHELHRAYAEAAACLHRAKSSGKDLIDYTEMRMERLFMLMPNRENLSLFSQEVLAQLESYDQEKNAEMIRTLKVFFDDKFNKAQTARDMNIHLNTLNYRIMRIQELLNMDLSDPEVCALLYVALCAREQSGGRIIESEE